MPVGGEGPPPREGCRSWPEIQGVVTVARAQWRVVDVDGGSAVVYSRHDTEQQALAAAKRLAGRSAEPTEGTPLEVRGPAGVEWLVYAGHRHEGGGGCAPYARRPQEVEAEVAGVCAEAEAQPVTANSHPGWV